MPIQVQTLAPGPCSHPLLGTLLPWLLKRLGQTSRLKTKSFISILLSHMFRYNQNSWTNLLNESPALSAIAGPGRPGNTAGGLEFRGAGKNRRCSRNCGADGWGNPGADAWESCWLLELGFSLMHLDFEKIQTSLPGR